MQQTQRTEQFNEQFDNAAQRFLEHTGKYAYLILWWTWRHVKTSPKIALPSLALLAALGAGLFTHRLWPTAAWQWHVLLAVVAVIGMVNAAVLAYKEHNRPHVHRYSFEEALRRANLYDNPRFERPVLVRTKYLPSGDVELLVSGRVPPEQWLEIDVQRPFCATFGVSGFRSVERDAKGLTRLVLASGNLDEVKTADTKALLNEYKDKPLIPLGMGYDGVVCWNYVLHPHMLIAGSTGSGKTTLVRNILIQVLERGWVVYLIDPKSGVDYLDLEPRLADRIRETPNEALPMLEMLYEEHRQRLAILKAEGLASLHEAHSQGKLLDVPRILLAIDEMAVFSADTKDKAERDIRVKAQSYIERLTLAARATGISVLIASQYPTADVLGSQIRQQVFRISGRLDDEVASRTVLGVPGAEKIPASTGRFLCQNSGRLVEFQAFDFADLTNDT